MGCAGPAEHSTKVKNNPRIPDWDILWKTCHVGKMEEGFEKQHIGESRIAWLLLAVKSPLQKEVAEARDGFLTALGCGVCVSASLHSLGKRMSKNQPYGVNLCIT